MTVLFVPSLSFTAIQKILSVKKPVSTSCLCTPWLLVNCWCWCSISSVFMWRVHYQHSSVHRIFMITITSRSCPCVFVLDCCDFIPTSWDSYVETDCSRRLHWVTPVTCAFHKRLHFILQDRVHHHVTGCCHPGNVSLMDFHLRIKAWCQPAKVRPQPHEMHDRRLKSVLYLLACGRDSWQFKRNMADLHGKPLAAYLIWILSFQSPFQNSSDTNSVLNWSNFDEKPRHVQDFFFFFNEDGPEIQLTTEKLELLYPGMPATPSEVCPALAGDWHDMEGALWSATAFLG